jgi:hypothetical protein
LRNSLVQTIAEGRQFRSLNGSRIIVSAKGTVLVIGRLLTGK